METREIVVKLDDAGALLTELANLREAQCALTAQVATLDAQLNTVNLALHELTRQITGMKVWQDVANLRFSNLAAQIDARDGGGAPVAPATCTWTEDEDGNWETECGEMSVFIDGCPADNKERFCCYCGKPLVEVQYDAEYEANAMLYDDGEEQPCGRI